MREFSFNQQDSNSLKEFLASLEFGELQYPNQLNQLLEQLKTVNIPRTYITITYLNYPMSPNGRVIEPVCGVEQHLGYTDEEFDLDCSIKNLYGIYKRVVMEYGKAVYQLLNTDRVLRSKINKNVIYTIPYIIQHKRGHLVPVKRNSVIYSVGNDLGAVQLNFCNLQERIDKEILKPVPVIHHAHFPKMFEKELEKIKRIAIPRILADQPDDDKDKGNISLPDSWYKVAKLRSAGFSSKEIVKELDLSLFTVNKYSSFILNCVKEWFPKDFTFIDANDAVTYLNEIGFLDHLSRNENS